MVNVSVNKRIITMPQFQKSGLNFLMTYLYLPSIEFVLLIFCNIYFYILIDSNNIINRYSTNKLHLSDFDNTFAAVYKYCYSTNMCKSSDILESIRMINSQSIRC